MTPVETTKGDGANVNVGRGVTAAETLENISFLSWSPNNTQALKCTLGGGESLI